jgi:4-diphosphocytidyl-2C-methyl-D-erythritol kinase
MSGSGASVFAVFENEETRQATQDALAEERDWRKFAVATISREKWRETVLEKPTVVSD